MTLCPSALPTAYMRMEMAFAANPNAPYGLQTGACESAMCSCAT